MFRSFQKSSKSFEVIQRNTSEVYNTSEVHSGLQRIGSKNPGSLGFGRISFEAR